MTTTELVLLLIASVVGIGLALEDDTPAGKVAGCVCIVALLAILAFLVA